MLSAFVVRVCACVCGGGGVREKQPLTLDTSRRVELDTRHTPRDSATSDQRTALSRGQSSRYTVLYTEYDSRPVSRASERYFRHCFRSPMLDSLQCRRKEHTASFRPEATINDGSLGVKVVPAHAPPKRTSTDTQGCHCPPCPCPRD